MSENIEKNLLLKHQSKALNKKTVVLPTHPKIQKFASPENYLQALEKYNQLLGIKTPLQVPKTLNIPDAPKSSRTLNIPDIPNIPKTSNIPSTDNFDSFPKKSENSSDKSDKIDVANDGNLETPLTLNSNLVSSFFQKGIYYKNLGMYDEAIKNFEQAYLIVHKEKNSKLAADIEVIIADLRAKKIPY
jgi:tetratricopeptide (TPR) repeat protein